MDKHIKGKYMTMKVDQDTECFLHYYSNLGFYLTPSEHHVVTSKKSDDFILQVAKPFEIRVKGIEIRKRYDGQKYSVLKCVIKNSMKTGGMRFKEVVEGSIMDRPLSKSKNKVVKQMINKSLIMTDGLVCCMDVDKYFFLHNGQLVGNTEYSFIEY